MIALFAGGAGAFSMFMLDYTESPSFCGRCHTMKPQIEAHERGPHQDVKCGECHVAPGIKSFINAKINGSRQLFEIVAGTFPSPIKAEADKLPSPEVTCMKCHGRGLERPDVLRVRSRFAEDEANTQQRVGIAVHLSTSGPSGAGSIHGHNELKIQFVPSEDGNTIDWMTVRRPDGTSAQYIATTAVNISSLVQPEIEALIKEGEVRTFGCTDCHNRAGHELLSPESAIDTALDQGRLDKNLPYVKREAMRILNTDYESVEDANAAIMGLDSFYKEKYPQVAARSQSSIDRAVIVLRTIYRESASPEMKASYKVYPSNLGHQTGNGCFRCHDGGHVLVEEGAATKEPLAWECSTCHTFPVWGSDVVNVVVSQAPASHAQPLWLFEHKDVAKVSSPVPEPCSNCHTATFCSNCHKTGVRHDQMLFSHAALARERGTLTCSYCHQKVYCSRCHSDQEVDTSRAGPSTVPR